MVNQLAFPPAIATQAEAEAGLEAFKRMSPLRTAQAIAALASGGGYADFVTVGTSGDYATVNAAIVAGKNHIVLLSNVTEAATSAVPAAGMILDLNGFTLTMGNFAFTTAGAYPIHVIGNGGEIDYTHTTTTALFDVALGTPVNIRHAIIDNNSTVGAVIATPANAIWNMHNVEIRCNNVASAEVSATYISFAKHFFSDIHFVGGGTSCFAMSVSNANVSNISVSEYFSTGTPFSFGLNTSVSGFLVHGYNNIGIQYAYRLSDVSIKSGLTAYLHATSSQAALTNVQGQGAAVLYSNGYDELVYSDVNPTTLTLSVDNSHNMLLSNVSISAAATLTNDDNARFVNCNFTAGVTVAGTSNDVGFHNTRVGSAFGGGATTITIQAGSNRTRVTGCTTDAAISDAGTGSSLTGNTVY